MVVMVLLMLGVISASAQTALSVKPIGNPDNPPPEGDDPKYSHKIPPRPITVFLDFESGEILFSADIADEVVGYEVWVGDICLLSTDDAPTVLDTLASLNESPIT